MTLKMFLLSTSSPIFALHSSNVRFLNPLKISTISNLLPQSATQISNLGYPSSKKLAIQWLHVCKSHLVEKQLYPHSLSTSSSFTRIVCYGEIHPCNKTKSGQKDD
ncbi:conserved hypothetical protein [Ricinus communis]|uniref:Uncharacterized protein n=1 Tax=Ricinus communis TaxID=3988 RepID=B9SXA7_RICCO|nr:conserved hypothetical protein [Ricinus communis]